MKPRLQIKETGELAVFLRIIAVIAVVWLVASLMTQGLR
jgi:hypothetical protein